MSVQEEKLTEIADAIRTVKGGTDLIPADEFKPEILGLLCQNSKTVNPAASTTYIKPDTGFFGMKSVTITAGNTSSLYSENIKKGVKIFGIVGTLDPSGPSSVSNASVNPSTFNSQNQTSSFYNYYSAYVAVTTSVTSKSYDASANKVTITLQHRITFYTKATSSASWAQRTYWNQSQTITINLA